ncbi:MAG: hypothetical protein Tsb0015_05610 [Simkaniaceae bacterium]
MQKTKKPIALIITKSAIKGAFFEKKLGEEYDIIVTDSESEVVGKIQSLPIALIILDEKAPGFDPIEFCQFIRSYHEYEDIPLFIITASLKKSWFRNLLNAGASDFLSDPLDEAELQKRLAVSTKISHTQKKMGFLLEKFPKQKRPQEKRPTFQGRFLLNDAVLKKISESLQEKKNFSLIIAEVDQLADPSLQWSPLLVEEINILIGEELKSLLRPQDILIPMGNGKYIILLPKTSHRAGQHFAEMIRDDVKNVEFETTQGPFSLTISIGLITEQQKAADESTYQHLDRLLKLASGCLEKAKKKGNQIVSEKKPKKPL